MAYSVASPLSFSNPSGIRRNCNPSGAILNASGPGRTTALFLLSSYLFFNFSSGKDHAFRPQCTQMPNLEVASSAISNFIIFQTLKKRFHRFIVGCSLWDSSFSSFGECVNCAAEAKVTVRDSFSNFGKSQESEVMFWIR